MKIQDITQKQKKYGKDVRTFAKDTCVVVNEMHKDIQELKKTTNEILELIQMQNGIPSSSRISKSRSKKVDM